MSKAFISISRALCVAAFGSLCATIGCLIGYTKGTHAFDATLEADKMIIQAFKKEIDRKNETES